MPFFLRTQPVCSSKKGLDSFPTFVGIAERPSKGPSHFHIPVLQVFQDQVLNGKGLPIDLVRMALVARHWPSQNQDLLEKEDVEFLWKRKERFGSTKHSRQNFCTFKTERKDFYMHAFVHPFIIRIRIMLLIPGTTITA